MKNNYYLITSTDTFHEHESRTRRRITSTKHANTIFERGLPPAVFGPNHHEHDPLRVHSMQGRGLISPLLDRHRA
jgi:hypothetical protein